MKWRRVVVPAALIFLAAVHLFATWRDLGRGPHNDEVEHLHTAARMARGDRIYVDFSQHHPPLLYGLLMPLVHHGDGVEAMRGYVTRARLLIAALTALAIAAAAYFVWRVSGSAWPAVILVGLVLGAGGIWRNGLGDIRPDSPAAALWWMGTVLALLHRRPALRGLGIGLVFAALLMNPKWPLMSLVVGIALLVEIGRDRRALLVATAAAVLTTAAALGAMALLADLRVTYFHAVELTRMMVEPLAAQPAPASVPLFYGCPPFLRPLPMLLATALVGAAWVRVRNVFAVPRLVPVLFAVLVASLLEIRFFYPYPFVDYRYYTNWVLAAAAMLALAPHAAAGLLGRKAARLILAASVVLALVGALDVIPLPRPQPDTYWRATAWMLARMRPGETVWLHTRRHPIGIPDASYYGIPDDFTTSLRVRETPEGRRFLPDIGDADLPPCRIEQGLARDVRFLSEPIRRLPRSWECFQRLAARGAVVRTPFVEVWMVPRS